MTFRSRILAAFGAALILVGGVIVFSYRTIRRSDEDQNWVEHTHEVMEAIGGLQSDMDQTAIEERGYFATEEGGYFEGYQEAVQRAQRRLGELQDLVKDNPGQLALLSKIQPLAEKREQELQIRIDFRKQYGLGAQPAPGQLTPVRATEEDLQGLVAEMKSREQGLLALRVRTAASGSRNTRVAIVMGGALALGLFAAGSLSIYHEMKQRKRAEEALKYSEEGFRLMISGVKDHALFMVDTAGRVATWNSGAERLKGYKEAEIVGQHFSRFYTPEEVADGVPETLLGIAVLQGWAEAEGWRLRKDGSRFWARVMITAVNDERGRLLGFGKMTHDMSERRQAVLEMQRRNAQLEAANHELEAFSYSVSHDLRAPLRRIDGFSHMLLEDYGDRLDAQGKEYLARVRTGTQQMGELIDDLLTLASITRREMQHATVDLSAMAAKVAAELQGTQPQRKVVWEIAPALASEGDPVLLRTVIENLLGNAWKFTSRREEARIEVGRRDENEPATFFVRDNGAGFDPAYSGRLFGAFQRLHRVEEFPGTGVGLASVKRIIHRHGGHIWAEGALGEGATFYFTLWRPSETAGEGVRVESSSVERAGTLGAS